MKIPFLKRAFLFTSFCIAVHVSCAQTDDKIFTLGTKTLYRPGQMTYTNPPAGYEPVFINYAGRHGARFLTKPDGDIQLLEILRAADDRTALTAGGKALLEMVGYFIEIEKNNYGSITMRGAAEQQGIAERMVQNNKQVFMGRGIEVSMTEEIRTAQSAKAFLSGLKPSRPEKIIYELIADSLNDKLRFYDISPGYLAYKKNREVIKRLDSLKDDIRNGAITEKLARGIFDQHFADDLMNNQIKIKNKDGQSIVFKPEWLSEALYGLYCIQFSMDVEIKENKPTRIPINFGSFFNDTALAWLNFKNCAADFMMKGPGLDSLGIQVTNSVPLLMDFISTTDSVVKNPGKYDACLRFAHAETISPFAALMGIGNASRPSSSIYHFDAYWEAGEIIPLSANIQWIVYSNGKDYLVRILLNEKEVTLPIETEHYPYYNWNDLKKYYLQKLNDLQISLADDTHKYLLQLK